MQSSRRIEPTQAQPKRSVLPEISPVNPPDSQETVKSEKDEWLEAFEEFWGEYPRKLGKFLARKSFMRITPKNQDQCDEIFAGLGRWVNYWNNNEIERQFIPYPATWLNQQRWEDHPE